MEGLVWKDRVNSESHDNSHELQRIARVSDQLATMHSVLRDSYRRRALWGEGVLLALSVVLCTLALADDVVFEFFSVGVSAARIWLGSLSAAVFLGILLTSSLDWRGQAADHLRASQTYAAIKLKAHELLAKDDATRGILMPELLGQYHLAGQTCRPVPDGAFVALKASHLRKVHLSRCLDTHPCMSARFVGLALVLRQTWAALCRSQGPAEADRADEEEE